MQVLEREFSALDIDEAKWAGKHPAGISGCIRVRNEAEFIRASVLSHLPYLDEVVLAVQPSEDNTEGICDALAAQYPGKVRVVRYPVIPRFISHPQWEETPVNSVSSFVYLSNWALAQCKYAWIAKFEADVVCLSSFQRIVDAIRREPGHLCYYGRVILNIAGERGELVSAKNPRNAGWDEAVFPNHPNWQFIKGGRFETINFGFAEHKCMGWSALHVKRCKARFLGRIPETYEPLNPAGVARALKQYNAEHPYNADDNPAGEACLFENDWRKYVEGW